MVSAYLKFDELVEGTEYGPYDWQLKEEVCEKYLEAVEDNSPLFNNAEYAPSEGHVAPPTIAAIYFLEAYYKAFSNRPPGVIHTKQSFHFRNPVTPGKKFLTKLKIINKYTKKGRLYVEIEGKIENEDGFMVSQGIMTLIWPE